MGQVIDGHKVGQKLIEAGVIPKDSAIRRIVIDIPADDPVVIYYETYGDNRVLDICLESLMANKKTVTVKGISELKG